MTDFAELEIILLPGEVGTHLLELVLALPGSETKARLTGPQPAAVHFDLPALAGLRDRPGEYGSALAAQLFAAPRAAIGFARAREAAQAKNLPLRLRLRAIPGPDGLHGLAWETLGDPEDDTPLALKQDIYFTRELARQDTRPVFLTARRDLRALVMVANPANLDQLGLAALDSQAEAGRAAEALSGIPAEVIGGPGRAPASLNRLVDGLRSGCADGQGFDILYLVSHGGFSKDRYRLVLEEEDRLYKLEEDETILQALKGLECPPRLVVLVACQGAKARPASADLVFASRLAEAGIAAVLALQGDFTIATAKVFMPAFFRELARDGQIDRAAAIARWPVRERLDFWMPALFTSLESGRIWKDETETQPAVKYQVTILGGKGNIVGDHNVINQDWKD